MQIIICCKIYHFAIKNDLQKANISEIDKIGSDGAA